jgi:transcriptional regulator with XRE-family HTH domain
MDETPLPSIGWVVEHSPQRFGQRIRRDRKVAGLSLERACAALLEQYDLGLTTSSLSRIERGEQKPSLGVIGALSALYGVRPASWFGLRPVCASDEFHRELTHRMVEFQRALDYMYTWQG